MNIKKKAIAVKLSEQKSKNGYNLFRLRNGHFHWIKEEEKKKPNLKPWWQLDCII